MAPRENFKIDKNDPDLLMFEQAIANFHPEFYALKQDGQPSYEHPDFCEKVLKFTHLPGCDEPYDILAMNLLNEDDIKHYLHDCLVLLGRPFAQLVKDPKQEQELLNLFTDKILDADVKYGDVSTTCGKIIDEYVKTALSLNNFCLISAFKSRLDKNDITLNFSDIEKIKRFCVDLCRIIEDLSNLYFFNMAEELELSTSKKYSLLSKAFLYLYQKSEKEFNNNLAKEILNTIPKKQKAVFGNCYIRSYVHVIISYELSQCSEKIEQERADKNIERKVKLLSPSTFLYMRYRMGNNADSLKRTYRWLFIKAWLYAYLKDKDLLAKKVGEIIADDDRFYYLKEKVSKNNPDSDVFSSRVETLTKEFSRWKKHICNNQYETGYLAGFLENKCHRHYWL